MKSSRKRPRPLLGLFKQTFPMFLSARKTTESLIHKNQHLDEFVHYTNGSLVNILGYFGLKNWA